MLTCRNGLGIYVSCHGKRLTAYRSVLLHNDSLWISSYYFSYSVINDRRDKVTSLRKENTFVTLLRNSRFRRIWFSCFLRTATCRTVWSHPCRDDSVSYATHRFIIAVDNKKQTPTKLHIPLYVCCTYRCYACHFKRKYSLIIWSCQSPFNKYTYAVRRYLLGYLYKRWCSFSILVTTEVHDVNLFIWLNFTHRYCHFLYLHKRHYCTVTTYNYERSF